MIKIRRQYNGFKMTFSSGIPRTRGISVFAKDVEAIHTCIDHYYMRKHDESNCPLCQKRQT